MASSSPSRLVRSLFAASLAAAFALSVGAVPAAGALRIVSSPPAPGTWRQQAPLPNANVENGVEMISATEGWAAGLSGSLLHTTDGGASWTAQSAPELNGNLNAVRFLDALHGWAAGDSSLMYTTNGEQTWQKSNSLAALGDGGSLVKCPGSIRSGSRRAIEALDQGTRTVPGDVAPDDPQVV